MRNRAMRRSLAWLLTAATVVSYIPVSAAEVVVEPEAGEEVVLDAEEEAAEAATDAEDSTEETESADNFIEGIEEVPTVDEAAETESESAEGDTYSYVYTGEEIAVALPDGETVTGGTASAVNVGEYTVELVDAEGATQELTWEITPATLTATCYYAEVKADAEDDAEAETAASEEAADIEVAVEVTGFVNGEDETTAAGYVAPQYTQPTSLEEAALLTAFGGEADNYVFAYADSVYVEGATTDQIATLAADGWKDYSYFNITETGFQIVTLKVLPFDDAIAEKLNSSEYNYELNVEVVTEGDSYNKVKDLLNAAHDNSVDKFGYVKLTLEDKAKNDTIDLSNTLMYISYAGGMGTISNTPSYVYGVSSSGLTAGMFDENETLTYADGMVNFTASMMGANEIAVVAQDDLVRQLAAGVYTVTANVTVLGENNTVLPFPVQVYVGNPNFPPVTPLSYNAKLVVDEDGTKTITVENFSEIFQIVSMSSGDTIHIKDYAEVPSKSETLGDTIGNMTVKYRHDKRINKLVLQIDNTSGLYEFGPCVQSPVILDEDTNMTMHLQVNFDEIKRGFDETQGTLNSRTFTDEATGVSVSVQTTEDAYAQVLADEGIKLEVKENTDATYSQMVREMYYNGTVDFKMYDIALKDKDGKEIDLSDAGNTETTLTMQTSYGVNRLWKLDGLTMKKMQANSSKNRIVYSDMVTGLGTFAVVDNNSAKQYAVAKTIAGDAMAIISQRQTEGVTMVSVTEDSNLAGYAVTLDVKQKSTNVGTAYYLSAISKADNSAISNFGDGTEQLSLYVPYDSSKNYYFVTDDGSNATVKKLDTSDNSGKYVMLHVLEETKPADAVSYSLLSKALKQAYDAGNGSETMIGGYILVTDKEIASAPMNVIGKKGEHAEIQYSGTEQQVITEGDHYTVISGATSATNAGKVSLTVKPESGYVWADGSDTEKTVTGEIQKHLLGVRYKEEAVLVNGTPKYEVEYGYRYANSWSTDSSYNFVNNETPETVSGFVAPTVPAHATDVAGDFTLTPTGGSADNYELVLVSGTLHVKESEEQFVKIPEIMTDTVYPVIKTFATSRTYIVPKDEETIQTVTAFEAPDESAGYTLSGNLSSNVLGAYQIQANVKDGYVWEDGTTGTKYYTYNIYQIIDKPVGKEKVEYNGKEQYLFDDDVIEAIESKSERFTPATYLSTNPIVLNDQYKETEIGEYKFLLSPGKGYCWDETGDRSQLTYNWLIVAKEEEREVASTEVITANLGVKGSDAAAAGLTILEQLAGADGYAYLTNPNAPTANSNEDNDPDWVQIPPTAPVSDNATLITYTDGTMALKVPVRNAVFTLQKFGSSEQVADEDVILTTRNGVYGTNTSRIDSITIPVTAKTGSITFTGCEVYPTLLMTGYTVPLTLTWGTETVQEQASISNADVTGITDATYTGSAITQLNLKVTVGNGLITLTEGKDYTVTYANNVNPGTATITITGIGNYKDTITRTFTIKKAETPDNGNNGNTGDNGNNGNNGNQQTSITGATVSGIADMTYTGSVLTQSNLKVMVGGSVLVEGKDYTVTYTNNVNLGTATITITGIGNYKDTITKTFTIAKAAQTIKVKVASKSYKYTSMQKKAASFKIGASASGKVTYKVTSYPKNGKKYITVSKAGKVTMKKKAPAGTYQITVSAAETTDKAAAAKTVTVKVTKDKQKITAKTSTKTYKAKSLAKKKTTYSIGAKAKGKLSYKVTSYPTNAKKYISVSKKGKVTMKKGAPKGTYKIQITAAATARYEKATKTVKIVVK